MAQFRVQHICRYDEEEYWEYIEQMKYAEPLIAPPRIIHEWHVQKCIKSCVFFNSTWETIKVFDNPDSAEEFKKSLTT